MEDVIKAKMTKSLELFVAELAKVRAGRAGSAMVETLKVEAYGSQMPLNQLATISVPDPSTITIQPWDASNLQLIQKAFLTSNLNLTPVVEANQIRISIPSLTAERRVELVKLIKNYAEETRISLRNIRKESLEKLERDLKEKLITEDEQKQKKDMIENLMKHFNKEVEEMSEHKINEVSSL